MVTEIPRTLLLDLYQAASNFQQVGAWAWMDDQHIFGVVHPETNEKAYCCVMGGLGEYFGLAVYIGPAGFRCLSEMNEEDQESDFAEEDIVYRQDCLICSFEDEDESDPENVELTRSLGLRFPGEKSHPGFQSYRPGFMPWGLDAREALWMKIALEQATVVAIHMQEDPERLQSLGIQPKRQLPFRVKDPESGWGYEPRDVDSPINLSPLMLKVPAPQLKDLKKLPKADNIWLFEQFFVALPSMEPDGDRPFFPKAIVLLDVEDGSFANIEAMKPEDMGEQAVNVIIDAFHTHKFVPGQFVVANRENYILLKGLCNSLDIDLYLDKEMNMIDELRESVMEMMEGADGEGEE